MPLMSCWVKTSMPARLVLRRPPRSGKREALPGGRKTSNGGNPSNAGPVGNGTGVGASGAGTKVPGARCRPDHRTEIKMGRYLLLWLLGVPIPILLLIWAFGGLH